MEHRLITAELSPTQRHARDELERQRRRIRFMRAVERACAERAVIEDAGDRMSLTRPDRFEE
jgi:hypothetical protein